MTTPVIHRVDLDAEPVFSRNGERGDVRAIDGELRPRRYDGTDAPGEPTGPPGNGALDRNELARSERKLASVLGC
jgi:hypothetical protein